MIKNEPAKIYLNLGDIEFEDIKDFNELSEISWSENQIDDNDIEYLNAKSVSPIFDISQLRTKFFEECVETRIFDISGMQQFYQINIKKTPEEIFEFFKKEITKKDKGYEK